MNKNIPIENLMIFDNVMSPSKSLRSLKKVFEADMEDPKL